VRNTLGDIQTGSVRNQLLPPHEIDRDRADFQSWWALKTAQTVVKVVYRGGRYEVHIILLSGNANFAHSMLSIPQLQSIRFCHSPYREGFQTTIIMVPYLKKDNYNNYVAEFKIAERCLSSSPEFGAEKKSKR
jgi:hypothetical protein